LKTQNIAGVKGAELNFVENVLNDEGFEPASQAPISNDLIADTDSINCRISLAALVVLQRKVGSRFSNLAVRSEAVQASLLQRPPCRWQKLYSSVLANSENMVSVEVFLDCGHNPAAVRALANRIRQEYSGRPLRVIYAMSRDKDVRSCLQTILTAVALDRIYFAEVRLQ
jgi:folylpolyglutamate synthase/dihydropteroate synthase